MNASGPIQFYLVELARLVVPAASIAFVLAGIIRSQLLANIQGRVWLIVVTSLWLFVTLANRFLLIAPIRKRFIERAAHDFASAHQTSIFLTLGAYGWTAEQILLLAFGILLFFALSSNARRNI